MEEAAKAGSAVRPSLGSHTPSLLQGRPVDLWGREKKSRCPPSLRGDAPGLSGASSPQLFYLQGIADTLIALNLSPHGPKHVD